MVTAVSSTPNPKRPPLLPSEADNGARRPKPREVTSRYLSSASSISTSTATSSSYSSSLSSNSSSSKRSPSPLVSRTAPGTSIPASSAAIRRSQSLERKRPGSTPRPSTPGKAGEVSAAAKLLVASTRNMSVSFQGTSFSLPVSKSKPAQATNGLSSARKATPAKDQVENSRPNAKHRWPGRSGDVNFLTRSLNCGYGNNKLGGSRSIARALQQSMIEESSKSSLTDRLNDHSMNAELDRPNSDSASAQSLSSGSIGDVKECASVAQVRGGPRGIVVPARFWQETTNRLRRKPEPGSPMSKNNGLKTVDSPKFNSLKKCSDNSASSPRGVSNSRGLSSPLRGAATRPASPSKFVPHSASPSRRMPSPSPVRNSLPINMTNNASKTSFILTYAADIRGGKAGDNRVFDIHVLRLLYTRHLQLRFINARADAAMLAQKETAERSMYNAWVATLKLRHSVKSKRVELQRLRQSLKLYSILKRQMLHLDVWDCIDRDHSNSLLGTTEALEASTVQLPVVSGARVDVQDVKDAICSAVEVMQTMVSSIGVWLTKVEHVSSLASEIAKISAKENALLYQCKDSLSALAALQVKDCSIKTHMLQARRVPSVLKTLV